MDNIYYLKCFNLNKSVLKSNFMLNIEDVPLIFLKLDLANRLDRECVQRIRSESVYICYYSKTASS